MDISNEQVKNMDVFMLVSILNMKLRDFYSNLDLLCNDNDIDISLLEKRLDEADYQYSKQTNQIVLK